MNSIEVANYIKQRIGSLKYSIPLDCRDMGVREIFNDGVNAACYMIDSIIHDSDLNKVVTSEFVVSSYPEHENCLLCNKNDIVVLLEGHPFKINKTNPEPDYMIIKCKNCKHQVRVEKNDGDSLMSLMYRAINEWNKRPEGEQMN